MNSFLFWGIALIAAVALCFEVEAQTSRQYSPEFRAQVKGFDNWGGKRCTGLAKIRDSRSKANDMYLKPKDKREACTGLIGLMQTEKQARSYVRRDKTCQGFRPADRYFKAELESDDDIIRHLFNRDCVPLGMKRWW